ncbi:MAG: Vps62-related protein [Methanomassiliicoccales archaeon]
MSHTFRIMVATFILFSVIMLPLCTVDVARAAEDGDGIGEDQERELMQRFAPIYYFHKDERVFPVKVEYFLSNCNLNASVGNSSILIKSPPLTAADLQSFNDPSGNYYLDDLTGTIHDTKAIEKYEQEKERLNYTIYCHVSRSGDYFLVQYWTFYVFNQGTYNNHEGDWEMVEVVLDAVSLQPIFAAYSQHNYGQRGDWSLIEKEGEHLKVYVAKGSHANYLRYWQGFLEFARDEVGQNGKILRPDDSRYELILLGDKGVGNRPAEQGWIDFAGAWGEWGNVADGFMGRRGPPGPGFREDGGMWEGLSWGQSRSEVTEQFLAISLPFYYFVWIYLAVIAIPFVAYVALAMRKIKRNHIQPPFIRLFDFKGKSYRSIGNMLALIGLVVGLVSAFFPYYTAELNADYADFQTGGWITMVSVSGSTGLQINALDPKGGLMQVGSLPIPFGLLVIISLMTFCFSLVAVSRKKAARKYAARGVNLLLPLIITFLIVISLGSILMALPSSAPVQMTPDVEVITQAMASNPLGGEETLNFPGYGYASLRWSIGIGAFLMALAGILLIIGGVFQLLDKEKPMNVGR